MAKIFECKPKCENLKLEGLVFGCDKCIKKTQKYIHLNKKQIQSISNIISNPFFTTKLIKEYPQETEELLNDFADWLHNKGYIDSDYYSEDPTAVLNYLEKKQNEIKR